MHLETWIFSWSFFVFSIKCIMGDYVVTNIWWSKCPYLLIAVEHKNRVYPKLNQTLRESRRIIFASKRNECLIVLFVGGDHTAEVDLTHSYRSIVPPDNLLLEIERERTSICQQDHKKNQSQSDLLFLLNTDECRRNRSPVWVWAPSALTFGDYAPWPPAVVLSEQ